jgi:GxxExxY protein
VQPVAIPEDVQAASRSVVDAALRVHTALGPGLLENVYEACLHYELSRRGLEATRQRSLPITYDGLTLEAGLRLDLLVADRLIVEIKAVDTLLPVHKAQLLTYLRLSGLRLGLLINFNVVRLKDGIHRIAH